MLNKENILRINKVDSCYIQHTAIKNAIDGIEKSILLSQGSKEPVNVMLTGKAGTGKTTACNSILLNRKKEIKIRGDCEVTLIPAFYCLVPNPVTIKGIASSLLSALGDCAPTRGTALEMTHRLGKLLSMCETQVIILDELQHLLKHDNRGGSDNVKDWLKSIINEYKVPIVIVGTPECVDIINTDNQLARRFTTRYELKNLEFGVREKGDFRLFIESLAEVFTKEIGLDSFLDFELVQTSLSIYSATGGNPADTANLFKMASLNALEDNRSHVGKKDFQHAFNCLALPNSFDIKDPFSLSANDLTISINNKLKRGR